MWKAVRTVSGKVNTKPPKNLTEQGGKPIDSPEKLAAVWKQFLERKFATTPAEQGRPEMEKLPPRNPTNIINPLEFDKALRTLKKNKYRILGAATNLNPKGRIQIY